MMAVQSSAGKYRISGVIELKTALHIGGGNDTSEIGSVDKSVVRDPVTREPYIPGSSLKGKLRTLLELYHYALDSSFFDDSRIRVGGNDTRHHECGEPACVVCRLFGATSGKNGRNPSNPSGEVKWNRPARLIVRDTELTDESRQLLRDADELDFFMTEVKFENSLDRITSAANPRQIERVPKGTKFRFEMIYTFWGFNSAFGERFSAVDAGREIGEDLRHLLLSFELLEGDYLGGNGSRGYGKVAFGGLKLEMRTFEAYRDGREWTCVAEAATLGEFVRNIRGQFSLDGGEREEAVGGTGGDTAACG